MTTTPKDLMQLLIDCCDLEDGDLDCLQAYTTGPLLKEVEDEIEKRDIAKIENHYLDNESNYRTDNVGTLVHTEESCT
jgi:hypothetical protein